MGLVAHGSSVLFHSGPAITSSVSPMYVGQLHAIYLYLQMKTLLNYSDSKFEKKFVAKQNMDSIDSDCPTRPIVESFQPENSDLAAESVTLF